MGRPLAQNNRRANAALANAAEALGFAAEQAEAERWRWVAIACCVGLQGALVAALSGYETASEADVLHPAGPGEAPKIAAIATLLRRAASADYLQAPERITGQGEARRAALDLVELRNRAVHVSPVGERMDFEGARAGARGVCALVRYLVVAHPAFDATANRQVCGDIDRALKRLSAAIC